jgi:hypothetical protein
MITFFFCREEKKDKKKRKRKKEKRKKLCFGLLRRENHKKKKKGKIEETRGIFCPPFLKMIVNVKFDFYSSPHMNFLAFIFHFRFWEPMFVSGKFFSWLSPTH